MVKKIKFFCSPKKEDKNKGHWSSDEQERFLKGCYLYKNDWEKIKNYIKTRTIPQIRSHAQKYLIKICRKYSIKLTKKKFSNKLSKHLDITKIPYKGKTYISKMSIYDKNILEMFNYYNREVLQDQNDVGGNNNENSLIDLNKFNNTTKIYLNVPQNPINIMNSDNLKMNKNPDKDNKKENIFNMAEKINNSQNNNNLLSSINQFHSSPLELSYNNLSDIKNNNNLKESLIPSLCQSPNLYFNNPMYKINNDNNNNLNNQRIQYNFLNYNYPLDYINNFEQNNFFIQNEYEFFLMQKISYYNTLLLNTIKSNQKINENILLLLGYNSKRNINENNVNNKNDYSINNNFV